MIYIVTIAVLLFFIVVFDLGKGKKSGANMCFNLTLLWFIAVSGIAYNVGSDTVKYMTEYDNVRWRDVFANSENRMFGWTTLELLCHSVSSNFAFFKIIIAIIGNLSIFRFIKRHSEYPYMSVLLYGVVLYLHTNFNALRQFLAISMFLFAFDYIKVKKWWKYYLLVLIAISFHISAIVCLFVPFVSQLKINKRTNLVLLFVLTLLSIIAFATDLNSMVAMLLVSIGDDFSTSIQYGFRFFDEDSSTTLNVNGILFVLVMALIYLYGLFNALKSKRIQEKDAIMYSVFVMLFVLNFAIPIFFFRLLFYFQLFYCCLLPSGIVNFCKSKRVPVRLSIILLLPFLYSSISNLFVENKNTGDPLIIQYYPYYSLFDPQIDPQRASLYGWHK